MAYAQWVSIQISAKNVNLTIKETTLNWGKFYACPDKDQEVSIETINGTLITENTSATICACGRSDAASGTEGSIKIYDGDILVGTYYWDCPWGSKTNTSRWTSSGNDNYITELQPGNLDSGAIGNAVIRCVKL